MSASTVPAVRSTLVQLLKDALTAAGDTTTEVTYGHPGRWVPGRFVAVCDTDEAGANRKQHTLPLRRSSSREEDYTLRLVVWAMVGDHEDQLTPTLAAWALADLIDDQLRLASQTDRLGGLVDWALPSRFDDADHLLSEGRAAEIVVSVSVHVTRS